MTGVNEQQIEIVRDEDPYSRIPKALIQDDRLRLQTRMVLIMMLSCRPDWDFSIRGMAKIAGVTKDTISKMMAELEAAGYVKRKPQARESAGQFAKAGYLVSGKPIFLREPEVEPCHENQDAVEDTASRCPTLSYTKEPYTINSPQINNKQVINNQVNNPPYSPPTGDPQGEEPKPKPKRSKAEPYRLDWFEAFWKIYPRKDSKQAALKAWCKLRPDRALCGVMAAALERDKHSKQWCKDGGEFIPMASTWINQRRWDDQGVDQSQLPDPPDPPDDGGWAPDPEVIE